MTDTWLEEEIAYWLDIGSGDCCTLYHEFMTQGMRLRLTKRSFGEEAEMGRRILDGWISPECLWARQFKRDARADHVETRAVVAVQRLEDTIRYLYESFNALEWIDVMEERERLEGIAILLQEAGAGKRLNRNLDDLDLAGWVAGRALPLVESTEMLRRVRDVEVDDVWWIKGID